MTAPEPNNAVAKLNVDNENKYLACLCSEKRKYWIDSTNEKYYLVAYFRLMAVIGIAIALIMAGRDGWSFAPMAGILFIIFLLSLLKNYSRSRRGGHTRVCATFYALYLTSFARGWITDYDFSRRGLYGDLHEINKKERQEQ